MSKRIVLVMCGLLAALTIMTACADKPAGSELLENGGMEGAGSVPDAWGSYSWNEYASFTLADSDREGGGTCAAVENTRQNKAALTQRVRVKKGATYRLSGWIRVTGRITSAKSGYTGAQLAIAEYPYVIEESYKVENGWEYFELYFTNADYAKITVEARVGSDGRDSLGKAYFDDVSLVRVESPPEGVSVLRLEKPFEAGFAGKAASWVGGVLFAALAIAAGLLLAGRLRPSGLAPKAVWLTVMTAAVFLTALAVRLAVAFLVSGHKYDMSCFSAWSVNLASGGPWNFYFTNGDPGQMNLINDYVPGYMYVLWALGGVRQLTGLAYNSPAFYGILKLPAIFCDLACAYLVVLIAGRRFSGALPLVAACLFLFNPMVIVNSAAWGQIESVTLLFTLLTLYLALKKKFFLSGLAFTLGVLFKFQTVFAFPAYAAYLIYRAVRHRELRWRLPLYLAGYAALFYALCLPFAVKAIGEGDWLFPFRLYLNQIGRYNYYVLNTFNLYGLLGLNWVPLPDSPLVGLATYGMIAVFSGLVVWLFFKGRDKSGLYLAAALTTCFVCMFAVKVHERYIYPGIALLLVAYLVSRSPRILFCYAGFSLLAYVNTVWLLLRDAENFGRADTPVVALSAAAVALFVYLIYASLRVFLRRRRGGKANARNDA